MQGELEAASVTGLSFSPSTPADSETRQLHEKVSAAPSMVTACVVGAPVWQGTLSAHPELCPEQGLDAEKATTAPAPLGTGSWWGLSQCRDTERTGGGSPGDLGRHRLSGPWRPCPDYAGSNLSGLREE